jgi:thioredoxin 1
MASDKVVTFTDGTFDTDVLQAATPVLDDFWAEWCGPCRALAPTIDALASDYGRVAIGKLNVDENPTTAIKYQIRGIPAVMLFKGGKVVEQVVRLRTRRPCSSNRKRLALLVRLSSKRHDHRFGPQSHGRPVRPGPACVVVEGLEAGGQLMIRRRSKFPRVRTAFSGPISRAELRRPNDSAPRSAGNVTSINLGVAPFRW